MTFESATHSRPKGATAIHEVPPAPRTPSKRAREVIFRYQGSQKVMLVLGVVFVLMGTLFTLVFCWGLPSDLAIAMTGSTVRGQVLSTQIDHSARVNGVHPTRIRVAYEVDGTRHETNCATTSGELVARVEQDLALRKAAEVSGGHDEAAGVDVEVASVNPSWARVKGTTRSTFGYGVSFVLLFPIVGAFLTRAATRSNRREIRAFTHGKPVVAKVVYAGPDTSAKMNGRHPMKIDWEFEVEGEVFTGTLSSMRHLHLEPFLREAEVTVIYDQSDPKANTVYID